MGLETAVLIGTIAAASASTYQAVDANQQRQKAKGVANKQQDKADQLAAEVERRRTEEEGTAAAASAASAARQKQKQRAGAGGGRRASILTGPLGLTDEAPAQRKSILGY